MGAWPTFCFSGADLGSLREDQRQQIWNVAERVARGYGLEIFEVQLRRESVGWVLRVIIDRPDDAGAGSGESVSLEDCQRVSEDVSAVLDVEDVLDRTYTLEVSSPGLDRPLRTPAEYRRFIGRLAKIVVSEAVDGQRFLSGRISDVTEGEVVLDAGARTHRIPLGVITRGRLEVEF